jgi:hypothetical protein
MGTFHFYRRVKIFPGLRLNISRAGPSLTAGVLGAHITVGRRGVTRTVGIPGTGIYYTSRSGHHTGIHTAHRDGQDGVLLPLILLLLIIPILLWALAVLYQ